MPQEKARPSLPADPVSAEASERQLLRTAQDHLAREGTQEGAIAKGRHVWRFFRAGGFDQVRLETGADLAALAQLDQKLWIALACPTKGIEFDETTLQFIDGNGDGRIRAPEVVAALAWAVEHLNDTNDLTLGRSTLPLSAIRAAAPDGARILASARAILRMLGKPEATEITLADTANIDAVFKGSAFNGDGVIPAEAADDANTRAVLDLIIKHEGAVLDRGGKPGVSQATSDSFFAKVRAYAAWQASAPIPSVASASLGERAAEAAVIAGELADKIDDFFTRCRLAAFDLKAGAQLNPSLAVYESLSGRNVSIRDERLLDLPLAHVAPEGALPFVRGVNPAWAERLREFAAKAAAPIVGARDSLTAEEWEKIKSGLAAYQEWLKQKPAIAGELDSTLMSALVRPEAKQSIDELIARDAALAPEMSAITLVDKLTRYQRDLLPLLNNMVSFRDFYTRTKKAVFQAGTLYLDGRSCELCVKVKDIGKHSQLASLSHIYLVYCTCTRADASESLTICGAVTAGDADNLRVGRNGIFYDRKGRDWDATIVHIVEHPISLRQAFWLPYKQATRMIGDLIQKASAARAANTQTQMMARAVSEVGNLGTPAAAPTPKEQAFDAARFAGIFAAIGLALGAIGTAIATVVTGFFNLAWWQMPLALLGLILAVSGPSLVIAAMKLRHRNLGPILDASGWAVNAMLRVNIPFGGALTAMAQLPPGAQRSLTDPYAEAHRPWRRQLATAVVIIAALAGLLWSGLLGQWWDRLVAP